MITEDEELRWRRDSPAALRKRNPHAVGPRSHEQGLGVLRGVDAELRRGCVVAVVQRSGESTVAQGRGVAEQGGVVDLQLVAATGWKDRVPGGLRGGLKRGRRDLGVRAR